MGQAAISRLNYDAVLGTEDYTTQQQVLENEIITRFMLGSGFPNQTAQFGIVDAANPSAVTSTETGRPLFVSVSTLNSLAVSVNSGYAIAPNGSIVQIASFQQTVILAATPQTGTSYVVIAQAAINTAAGTTQLNDYQINLSSQQTVFAQITVIPYVAGWQPATNQIVLAVVAVLSSGSSQSLQIDQTQNTYSFNRPWYSTVDTQHRSHIGSGTVTPTNPHATSINDLTIPGTVGVFQGLTGEGMIVSRSRLRNKMLGAVLCNQQVVVLQDSTGTITAGSPYSAPFVFYAYLPSFPLRLGSVYTTSTPADALSAEVIPGTNMLVFGPNEDLALGQTINVQYTSCSALLPPTTVTTNTLAFQQPETGEVIVAGGFTYPSVADPNISLEGSGPFARAYYVYLMPSGVLETFPEILVPAQSALTSILGTYTPVNPARISVGITNTTGSPNLNVVVTITGTVVSETGDTPGNVTETLTFTPANGYIDQIVPSSTYDLPGQILITQNVFSTVTTISCTASNAGTGPQIQVWAEVEPGTTPEMNDATAVAKVYWNGTGVPLTPQKSLEDIRVIRAGWQEERSYLYAAGEAELDSILMLNATKNSVTGLANTSVKLFTEDFEDLKFFDSLRGFADPLATGTLTLASSIAVVAGDTVQLTPTISLLAVPNAPTAPGQFNVGSTLAPLGVTQIASNMATAINDPSLASLISATILPSNLLVLNLVLQSPIVSSSVPVTMSATVANAGSIVPSGFTFAFDGYGECYMDRGAQGLNSPLIPLDANLNPYQFSYRRRYRSRSISMPAAIGAQTHMMIEIHGQNKSFTDSVRIRGSLNSTPTAWGAWQIASVVPMSTKGLYQVTFGQAVHKIQVEYYGRARGLSVYMTRP